MIRRFQNEFASCSSVLMTFNEYNYAHLVTSLLSFALLNMLKNNQISPCCHCQVCFTLMLDKVSVLSSSLGSNWVIFTEVEKTHCRHFNVDHLKKYTKFILCHLIILQSHVSSQAITSHLCMSQSVCFWPVNITPGWKLSSLWLRNNKNWIVEIYNHSVYAMQSKMIVKM